MGHPVKKNGMAGIKSMDDAPREFIMATHRFLQDAVVGSSLRMEAVVSGESASAVFSLVPSYGARLSQFVLSEEIVFSSDKSWPYYVDLVVGGKLRALSTCVEQLIDQQFNRAVSDLLFEEVIYFFVMDCYLFIFL